MQPFQLHFSKHGNGPKSILFFHGFGQELSAFSSYIEALKSDYRLYLIDLPHHGSSPPLDQEMTKIRWAEILENFLETESIDQFSIVSFSLGGRYAISSLFNFRDRIEYCFLIAPDAIYPSIWYKMATNPIGNVLFKFAMTNDLILNGVLWFSEKTRLAPKSLIRFANKQIPTRDKRLQLYATWTNVKNLKYKISLITEEFNTTPVIIHVILGEEDIVIPPVKIKGQLRDCRKIHCHIIPSRHGKMIEKSLPLVSRLLKGG
ncbi:alpha/beta hydrolase [Marinoscillum sp. MHG1-6]|uniref:alpha/beta hydrolase n=1 Tax=Marinoscillum sp. MHG1-6 TaxID=2959627 RepID=UPI002158557D|nr:alpha/beta hydrolase [Marinoscillum sp. MHG1-6]